MRKKSTGGERQPNSDGLSIVAIGLSLIFFLGFLRAYILSDAFAGLGILAAIGKWALASQQDFAVAVLLTSPFLLIGVLFRWKPATAIFFCIALTSVLWGAANIEVVKTLGQPLTLSWLYYADFFSGLDSINGMMASVTIKNLLLLGLLIAGFFLCTVAFQKVVRRVAARERSLGLLFVLIPAVALSVLTLFDKSSSSQGATALNPVVAFVQSVLLPSDLGLSTSPTQDKNLEGTVAGEGAHLPPPSDKSRQAIKNVVFFVLESTPAEYVQNYGGEYEVTPNLMKYASKALRFDNMYAHAPATNYSLFSLVTSLYPEVGPRSMTEKYPDLALRSIGNVLSEKGYRTGFFNSADSRFQSSDIFMRGKGFDVVQDFRGRPCDTTFSNSSGDWKYMDFSHDKCTVKSLIQWIDQDPGKPFFGMTWTGMTHYPYFNGGNEKSYVSDINLNRYLNALHVGDEAFGDLMNYLEEHGLAKSTLVVVFGDHGEAFGRHKTFVHASGLYEENVHIPLLLINEGLFSGGSTPVLGGMSDIPATALDILQVPLPPTWQGHSLFAASRPARIFFFAPWNGFQVGFREGSRKFIYRAEAKSTEMYDLATDPHEKNNLASEDPKTADSATKILTAWVQSQNQHIADLLNGSHAGTSNLKPASAEPPGKITIYASGTKYKTPPTAQVFIDDESAGYFSVQSAPSNSEHAVGDDEISAAVSLFEFFPTQGKCPRKIEIRFLNDEWAGEGLSGDTNLMIKEVRVGNRIFAPTEIQIDDPDAVSVYNSYLSYWRKGRAHIDLDQDSCR